MVGGGVAGMTAALALAEQGYPVHLVERSDHLGGNALKLNTTWRGEDIKTFVAGLIEQIEAESLIRVMLKSEIKKTSGFLGNFETDDRHPGGENRPCAPRRGHCGHGRPADRADRIFVRPTRTGQDHPGNGRTPGPGGPGHQTGPGRGLHPVRGVAGTRKTLLFQDLLHPFRGKRPAVQGTQPGHHGLCPVPGHPDLRLSGRSFTRKPDPRGSSSSGTIWTNKPVVEPAGPDKVKITVIDHVIGLPVRIVADYLTLAAAIEPNEGRAVAEAFKVQQKRGQFFPGSPYEAAPGRLCHGRHVPGRAGPLSQAHRGIHCPGPGRRGQGLDHSGQGHDRGRRDRGRGHPGKVRRLPDLCPDLPLQRAPDRRGRIRGDRTGPVPGVRRLRGRVPGQGHYLQHFTDEQILAKAQALVG